MKLKFCHFLGFTLLIFSNSSFSQTQKSISLVKIDTLLIDKISIRAIEVSKNKVWYSADKNRVGVIDLYDKKKIEKILKVDTLKTEFRSIAQIKKSIFTVNVGNPANLYKISKDLQTIENVYVERNEKVFYDGIKFWNENEGIAFGDPIENCFCIIKTIDGGKTWNKTPCEKLPKLEEGEAAFAASNSTINVYKNNTWIFSGGKKSRVFFSKDKGETWTVFETPIVQGQAMTGIFTADFYNEKIGFVSGGNYEKLNQNFQNKAITFDGGKTWKLVAENAGFGYASCVQFVPKSNGKDIVSIGVNGLFYSNDFGNSWKQFSTDSTLYTIRFIDSKTAVAAGKNKVVKITFQ